MRKLFLFLIVSFAFLSCEEEKHSSVKIEVAPEALLFNLTAATKTAKITSNVKWVISTTESWCTVTPTFGEGNEVISISVGNYDGEYRMARITVENAEGPGVRELIVTQKTVPLIEN